MLSKLRVSGFKSLRDVTVELPSGLTVLFGPNAAGKSNLVEAIHTLSVLSYTRTLEDALGDDFPVRGKAIESFSFPPQGLPSLLKANGPGPRFVLEADLKTTTGDYRYHVEPQLTPASGRLGVADEYLARLTRDGTARRSPAIERREDQIHVRRKGQGARPWQEPVGLNHSILSDRRYSGNGYEWLDSVREELANWRTYYFDPRISMRSARPPGDVVDIGVLGQFIAPFLYKLRAEMPKHYDSVRRTLRAIVPNIEDVSVGLDEQQGTLYLTLQQDGISYSHSVVSEGTLRVLALCAIATNPWATGLIALEEPENGVHPRRLEMIAQLLVSVARQGDTQVVVTTHSPLLVSNVLRARRSANNPQEIGLFSVHYASGETSVVPFDPPGKLFEDAQIAKALSDQPDVSVIQGLMLRGLIGHRLDQR